MERPALLVLAIFTIVVILGVIVLESRGWDPRSMVAMESTSPQEVAEREAGNASAPLTPSGPATSGELVSPPPPPDLAAGAGAGPAAETADDGDAADVDDALAALSDTRDTPEPSDSPGQATAEIGGATTDLGATDTDDATAARLGSESDAGPAPDDGQIAGRDGPSASGASVPAAGSDVAEGETAQTADGTPPRAGADPASETANAKAPPPPDLGGPELDVVRVEPSGEALIAGRGEPDSDIEIVADGIVIAQTRADANGAFIAIPNAPLAPGGTTISARSRKDGDSAPKAGQQVAIVVPGDEGEDSTAVAAAGTDGEGNDGSGDAGSASDGSIVALAQPRSGDGEPSAPAASGEPGRAAEDRTDIASADQGAAAPVAAGQPDRAGDDRTDIAATGEADEPAGGPAGADPALRDSLGVSRQPVPGGAGSEGGDSAEPAPMATAGLEGAEPSVPGAPASSEPTAPSAPDAPAGEPAAGTAIAAAPAAPQPGEPASGSADEGDAADGAGPTVGAGTAVATIDPAEPARSGNGDGQEAISAGEVESVFDTEENELALVAVETEGQTLYVAGEASPGAQIRVFADDQEIGQTRAGPEGRWLLQAEQPLENPQVVMRAEELARSQVEVAASTELEFVRYLDTDILVPAASALPSNVAASGGGIAAPEVVIIRRGDTLWQISRRNYGRGIRYKTIFSANRDDIRNPHWIYPGQVFVVPKRDRSWEQSRAEAPAATR